MKRLLEGAFDIKADQLFGVPDGLESKCFDIALPILTKALLHFPHLQHFTPYVAGSHGLLHRRLQLHRPQNIVLPRLKNHGSYNTAHQRS